MMVLIVSSMSINIILLCHAYLFWVAINRYSISCFKYPHTAMTTLSAVSFDFLLNQHVINFLIFLVYYFAGYLYINHFVSTEIKEPEVNKSVLIILIIDCWMINIWNVNIW